MFATILIANRGEIACRVIDTCRRLGVRTVAVHSDVDRGARHVAMADEAVSLGGAAPADSYLRGDAIIEAARATGAEAIHPGYGFLSENPAFVEAVEAAGLVFIGPSASAIRAMGLKDAAKDLMEKAGVPVVPGYRGENQDPAHLARQAGDIGYPVLIKAVAGGGGKGMRRVEAPDAFADALEAAKSEAAKAFGNDHVLIEKWIASPRHIEVQVFGDGTRALHLFERDCSLQRRHQKVIEEAPAPGMTPEMRAAMGDAAVRAAEAIGYSGAGTVEFIVDGSDGLRPDGFWFMEMNTRLQVEHPVTEAITGVDLVEWQLRVASGEPLPAAQEDLTIEGHAFEARLYAEDAENGFLPQTGRLTHLRFPPGVRAETGVRAGDTISPWYDPMIAKVVVHGPTRATALLSLERALAGTRVAGTVTNLAFLRRLARHEGFRAGDVDTGLIDRDIAALSARPEPSSQVRALAALAALGLDRPQWQEGAHLWTPLAWTARLVSRGDEMTARVEARGGGSCRVTLEDAAHEVTRDGGWRIDGAPVAAEVAHGPGVVHVFDDDAHSFDVPDPLAVDAAGGAASGLVEAPMPGLVKAVFVETGATVAQGDRLAVLEAMKMEHVLTAPRDGTVAEVLATAGTQVEAGAPLIRMEEE
ncbi:acetyl-CoA carboxylase biotin carboxylase subunit [Jannaschia rubra]|uniref:Acetyl-/propionyl-coenzyme A carboxylase alpha chain n=1 Tax=Jannaschia rubra TaxID=282197 RepID=A0A0M6XR20_9RHOB|nr:acetyl/propionyl/methylcrotonyl-CoA carboxylase subunit alpha [Jannaschia rubra]CTQ33559.1 Acetyl-/propionyl-coenzyme A carboxylase alpha chain [Jannaschia rubra]SFG03858.1 3-methylcrotonyl-CoA carboxylase alpha subunit [Jannaschia rubra]